MKFKIRDKKEWRHRFALLPKEIKGYWIWLEWYDVTGWYPAAYGLQRDVRYPSQLK